VIAAAVSMLCVAIGTGALYLPVVGMTQMAAEFGNQRQVPSLASLNLPPGADLLARLQRGLVLVGGATGSGKTTTLAALVEEINGREAKHIITIEDPIEYEHVNRMSVIEQVEIGVDAPDFPAALRSALRQMPDVLVIGEMRDPESMQIALAAGETGQLVFSTLHTTDVPSTIARMTDSFPAERQPTDGGPGRRHPARSSTTSFDGVSSKRSSSVDKTPLT